MDFDDWMRPLINDFPPYREVWKAAQKEAYRNVLKEWHAPYALDDKRFIDRLADLAEGEMK